MRYQGPTNNHIELNSPRGTHKKRRWPYVVLILMVVMAGLYLLFGRSSNQNEHLNSSDTKATKNSVRLIAVGDNIPHDTVNQQAKADGNGTYNYTPIYVNMKPFFDKASLRFCNVETALGGEELGISGYPTFNAPFEFAKDLHGLGCNIINTANNHVADKGTEGIKNTRDIWDTLSPSAVSGANRTADEQNKVTYTEQNGIKIAFVSFSEISNNKNIPDYSLNMFDPALVQKLLGEARKNADFVVVSAHWGTEDSPDINAAQEQWAKTFADEGADVVIGTGPHVLQPVKEIPNNRGGKTLVWYSIGNFMSTQLAINELVGGVASMELVKQNGKVAIKDVKFLPIYMHYDWSAADATSQNLLARKNLKLYPLDQAAEQLKKSTHNTTAQAQQEYVKGILTKFYPVELSTSQNF